MKSAKLCADCGEEIERGRVHALPFVETCVHCQRHREHTGQFKRYRMDSQVTYATGGEIEETVEKIVKV